jgi:hypothetical protein
MVTDYQHLMNLLLEFVLTRRRDAPQEIMAKPLVAVEPRSIF